MTGVENKNYTLDAAIGMAELFGDMAAAHRESLYGKHLDMDGAMCVDNQLMRMMVRHGMADVLNAQDVRLILGMVRVGRPLLGFEPWAQLYVIEHKLMPLSIKTKDLLACANMTRRTIRNRLARLARLGFVARVGGHGWHLNLVLNLSPDNWNPELFATWCAGRFGKYGYPGEVPGLWPQPGLFDTL